MKLQTDEFKAAFNVIDNVSPQSILPSSQNVRFECTQGKLNIALTGIEFSESSIKLPTNGTADAFFVDRRVVGAFLNNANAESIELAYDDSGKQITFRAGRSKVTASAIEPITGYANWRKDSKYSTMEISANLRRVLGTFSEYAAPSDSSLSHLSAVYLIDGFGVIATDTFVLAACLDKHIAGTLPIPASLARLVKTTSASEIVCNAKVGAAILYPKLGYVYQAVNSNIENYPLAQFKTLVDRSVKAKPASVFDYTDLRQGIEYIGNFLFGAESEVFAECVCTQGQREATLQVITPRIKTQRKVPVTARITKSFKWPISKLKSWLEFADGKTAEISVTHEQGMNSFVFKSDDGCTYALLIVEVE